MENNRVYSPCVCCTRFHCPVVLFVSLRAFAQDSKLNNTWDNKLGYRNEYLQEMDDNCGQNVIDSLGAAPTCAVATVGL